MSVKVVKYLQVTCQHRERENSERCWLEQVCQTRRLHWKL